MKKFNLFLLYFFVTSINHVSTIVVCNIVPTHRDIIDTLPVGFRGFLVKESQEPAFEVVIFFERLFAEEVVQRPE